MPEEQGYGEQVGEQEAETPEQKQDKEQAGKTRDPIKLAEFWGKEITSAEKWLNKFKENGKKIKKIYLSTDPTGAGINSRSSGGTTHFNLFWSNVQVVLAATYASLPMVDVSRKYKDYEDDVARVAGIMLQRILNSDIFDNAENTDETFKNALLDRYVPGLGQVWCRYDFDEVMEKDPTSGQEYPTIGDESVPMDHVRWEDFVFSPCRTWTELRWGARKHYMTKEMLTKKFGAKITTQIKLDVKSANRTEYDDPQKSNPQDMGTIYEIWCKETKHVYWFAKGCQYILEAAEDPLKLKNFFPFPRPLVATLLTNNFIPRPDYVIVQDQYAELEMVTRRLSLLTEACRVTGAYDKESGALNQMLTNTGINSLIPVDNWALFSEKGGVKGAVDWFPLEMVTSSIDKLTQRKKELMQEIYEILGISDLMRGSTKASETATAQNLKAQFGGQRVDMQEKSIAVFITQAMQIRGEIIAAHWQPETIIEKSQIMMTPDKKYAQAAVQMLKQRGLYDVKLEVLADTIAAPDWENEKRQRTEFLQATSQFIGMSMPLIKEEPQATPFLVQMLQWAAAGFHSGKTLEGVLDQALQALTASVMQPKPPPPLTPEDRKNLSASDKNVADADKTRWEINMPPLGHMRQAQLPPLPQQEQQGGPPPQGGGNGQQQPQPGGPPPAPGMAPPQGPPGPPMQ